MTESKTIDSDVTIGRKPISGVVEGEDLDDVEYLGHAMFATTGDVIVPRDWLVEQFDKHGLPESLLPNETWPSSAYKQAMSRLLDDGFRTTTFMNRDAEYQLDSGEDYWRILKFRVFLPEEVTETEGGEWRSQELGRFNYDKENQRIEHHPEIGEGNKLWDRWSKMVGRAQGRFEKMLVSHDGQDMRAIVRDLRQQQTSAIPLRKGGAVYFFPAGYDEYLEALSAIWRDMNQYKDHGYPAHIGTFPVLDNADIRRLVEQRAEEMVQERVEDAVEAGLETLSDNEEDMEDIASEVAEDLQQTADMAVEYNQLLDIRLSITEHLQEWLEDLEDDQETLVREVLEGDDFVEADDEDDGDDLPLESEDDDFDWVDV